MRITWDNIAWNYVNLDHRTDRRAHAEQEFAKQGIVPRRQPGLLITRDNCRPSPMTERMYNRTPGAIGCWLSQVEALKQSPADKIAAICEDDICFCDDLRTRIDYMGAHLPHYWDVAWLGATFHCRPAKWHLNTLGRDADRVGKHIFRAYGIWSTYGWLVNPDSRDKVCAMLDYYMPDSDGIDDCFIKFLEPQLWTYFMTPGCAWQYDDVSNIGTGISEFSAFRYLGPYVWSRKMEDFDPTTYHWGEAADYVYGPGRVEIDMPVQPLPANASLVQMGDYFDTDKGTLHGYLEIYDELFAPLRHKPIDLLEIGISAGGSLQMWLEYFTQAQIFSADINIHSIPAHPRLHIQQCNQSNTAGMRALFGDIKFDIIIDDGDHADLAQRSAFSALWDRMQPGGIYIVEDLQYPETSVPYWQSLGGTAHYCKAGVSSCVVLRKPGG